MSRAAWLLSLLLSATAAEAAADGVTLSVARGPGAGDVTLTWSGGLPVYSVYRATDPSAVVTPSSRIGETSGSSWVDAPPPAAIVYFAVTPGCGLPTFESCATANNLGTVSDHAASGFPVEVTATRQAVAVGQSRWYKVHAGDLPTDGWKLLAKVFNVSPGTDVDLYAYRREPGNSCTSSPPVTPASPDACNQDISGCGGGSQNSNRCSLNGGNADECVSWFRLCFGPFETEETEVWIEVRHAAGACGIFDLKIRNNGDNDSFTCVNY